MKTHIRNNAFLAYSLKIAATVALAGFLSLPGAMGQALTTFYETGFETPPYTLGALTNQQGWGSNAIGTVVGTVGDIVPPEGTRMLEVTRPTVDDGSVFANAFAGFNQGAKEDFLFSFKIAADVKSNAAIGLSIGSTSTGSGGAWAGIRAIDVNNFGFYYRNGNSGWTQLGINTVTLGEFYTFKLQVDFDANTFGIAVYDSSNVLQGSASDIGIYFTGTNSSMSFYNRVYNQIDQIGATKFYVDDILVQAIPEPGTFALALLGTAVVFLSRRRRMHGKG